MNAMSKANDISIALETPNQAEVMALIADLDAYQHSLYPAESVYSLDLSGVEQGQLLFAVARNAAGGAIGCGAVVLGGAVGELKRMYVQPNQRGLGIASKLLAMLEFHASKAGCRLLQLETGPLHHEALILYARCGYQTRAPFGGYADDPLSVFMEKSLAA
ncbi:GNAT family N-acetyltransferase [Undibacterium sp. TJN25]|uniref:GNAT family N-acetyltransferase n=1 Tax=Undibacterium sp. TJN25 TaxID=3413056 RepID=UPI003BF0F00F